MLPRLPTKLLLSFLVLACPLACGIEDPDVHIRPDGSGGTDAEDEDEGTGGGEAAIPCKDGQKRCTETVAEICEFEEWVTNEECGASTPVCSEGACVAFRLSGAIETFGTRPKEKGAYVLKAQSLALAPRACDASYCVTGGIR